MQRSAWACGRQLSSIGHARAAGQTFPPSISRTPSRPHAETPSPPSSRSPPAPGNLVSLLPVYGRARSYSRCPSCLHRAQPHGFKVPLRLGVGQPVPTSKAGCDGSPFRSPPRCPFSEGGHVGASAVGLLRGPPLGTSVHSPPTPACTPQRRVSRPCGGPLLIVLKPILFVITTFYNIDNGWSRRKIRGPSAQPSQIRANEGGFTLPDVFIYPKVSRYHFNPLPVSVTGKKTGCGARESGIRWKRRSLCR